MSCLIQLHLQSNLSSGTFQYCGESVRCPFITGCQVSLNHRVSGVPSSQGVRCPFITGCQVSLHHRVSGVPSSQGVGCPFITGCRVSLHHRVSGVPSSQGVRCPFITGYITWGRWHRWRSSRITFAQLAQASFRASEWSNPVPILFSRFWASTGLVKMTCIVPVHIYFVKYFQCT